MTKPKKAGKAGKAEEGFVGVTDADRGLWWNLARKYMRDSRQPAIQRWAWERAAAYINPKVAAVEQEKGGSKEFVVKVEDYRSQKESIPDIVTGRTLVEVFKEEAELEDALVGMDDEDVH